MRIDSPQIVGNLSVAEGSEAVLTGSFTGSFTGDGSGLTGVAPIAGTGIDVTGTTVSTNDSEIVITSLSGYVANEHIDHSGVSITAGTGLTGGGDITATRTLNVDTTTIATVAYTDQKVADVVNSAPAALDTLNELAAALGDDANFATTTATSIGEKLAKASNLSDVADAATAATNLGLGTLDSVQFNAIGVGTAPSGAVGSILATNDIVAFASSDERLKENVTLIEGALDKVEAMRGVEYDWIAGNEEIHINHGHDLGVIAQEVEAVLPVLVQTRDNGYKAVKYDRLTAVLIEAVKELSARVKELESK